MTAQDTNVYMASHLSGAIVIGLVTALFIGQAEDPRVLWGIEGATPKSGMLPGGKKENDLVKESFTKWKDEVRAWVEEGMKCE